MPKKRTNAAQSASEIRAKKGKKSHVKDSEDAVAAQIEKDAEATGAHRKLLARGITKDPPGAIHTRMTRSNHLRIATPEIDDHLDIPLGAPASADDPTGVLASLTIGRTLNDAPGSPALSLGLGDSPEASETEASPPSYAKDNASVEKQSGADETESDGDPEAFIDDNNAGDIVPPRKLYRSGAHIELELRDHQQQDIMECFAGSVDVYTRGSTHIALIGDIISSCGDIHSPIKQRQGYIYRKSVSGDSQHPIPVGKVNEVAEGTAKGLKSDAIAELPLEYSAQSKTYIAQLTFLNDKSKTPTPSAAVTTERLTAVHRPERPTSTLTETGRDTFVGMRSDANQVPVSPHHLPPLMETVSTLSPASGPVNIDRRQFSKSGLSTMCLDWLSQQLGGPTKEWDICVSIADAWEREKACRAVLSRAKKEFRSGNSYSIKFGPFKGTRFKLTAIQDVALVGNTTWNSSLKGFAEAQKHEEMKAWMDDPSSTDQYDEYGPKQFWDEAFMITESNVLTSQKRSRREKEAKEMMAYAAKKRKRDERLGIKKNRGKEPAHRAPSPDEGPSKKNKKNKKDVSSEDLDDSSSSGY